MMRYLAPLIGAWVLACSSDKPPESAYDASLPPASPPAEGAEPGMTPASSDAALGGTATAGPDTSPGVDAPARTDTARTDTAPVVAQDKNQPRASDSADESRAPDNTNVNERDRNSATLTPGDQGENQTDLKITQRIRQALMGDDTLSLTAKNVKIITRGGKVTLRGPVRSADERKSIEAAARTVAGAANVDSQLEVAK